MNALLSEGQAKQIEYAVAWGTVAYIAGFFIVMIHTARLGIPVIQILEPVYIWIGLPLAIVLFAIRWIVRVVISRVSRFRAQFRELRDEYRKIHKDRHIEEKDREQLVDGYMQVIDSFLRSVILLPFVASIVEVIYRPTIEKLARKEVDRLIGAGSGNSGKWPLFLYSRVRFALIGSQIISETFSFLYFIAVVSLIPVACYLYVVEVYPRIPQSFGGGKPASVVLVLKTEELPRQNQNMIGLFPVSSAGADAKSVSVTDRIELLYLTDETYYVRTTDGHVLSLNKDLVQSIVWNPNYTSNRQIWLPLVGGM